MWTVNSYQHFEDYSAFIFRVKLSKKGIHLELPGPEDEGTTFV